MYEDEEDFYDDESEKLSKRVDKIVCEVFGHKPSKCEYTIARSGKHYVWTECKRCDRVLKGKRSPYLNILEEIAVEDFAKQIPKLFNHDNAFFKMLEKKPADIISARNMVIPLKIKKGGDFGR